MLLIVEQGARFVLMVRSMTARPALIR